MSRYGLTVLRLAVGAVFVAHGAQKLLGIWGGPGIGGTARFFGQVGLNPAYPLALLVAFVEFFGGILLVLGALTFFTALIILIEMAVAIWKVHYANGFFLSGRGHGLGYEYNVVLIGALFCIAVAGPGALSVDRRRARGLESQAAGRARLRGKV
jgi:putative oxidoreductase